jgi:hypothetical protein
MVNKKHRTKNDDQWTSDITWKTDQTHGRGSKEAATMIEPMRWIWDGRQK